MTPNALGLFSPQAEAFRLHVSIVSESRMITRAYIEVRSVFGAEHNLRSWSEMWNESAVTWRSIRVTVCEGLRISLYHCWIVYDFLQRKSIHTTHVNTSVLDSVILYVSQSING